MNSGRHAELRRHSDNGSADIAAEAYRKLGLEILDYLFACEDDLNIFETVFML